MDNSCIKEHTFLFWKWKVVDHDYRLYSIIKFMSSSIDFQVKDKCTVCGLYRKREFVTADELILAGISPSTLNDITDKNYYYVK
jgi:hypothetical protein